jgi:septal ring factor EnvC (AmiA/AmiB activator)
VTSHETPELLPMEMSDTESGEATTIESDVDSLGEPVTSGVDVVSDQVVIDASASPQQVRQSAIRRYFFPLLSAMLALLLVGVTAFCAVTVNDLNNRLTDTNRQLSDTESQLSDTKSLLDTANTQLADAKSQIANINNQLSSVKTQLETAQSQVTALETQVQHQTSCISSLNDRSAELMNINSLQNANFDAIAAGSAWATASTGWENAMIVANKDYYNAYLAAYNGQFATANSWVDAANAKVSTATSDSKKMGAAITSINSTTNKITAALSAFNSNMSATRAICAIA